MHLCTGADVVSVALVSGTCYRGARVLGNGRLVRVAAGSCPC